MCAVPEDPTAPIHRNDHPDVVQLRYLQQLTIDFERDGRAASCILVYAEPDPDGGDSYHAVVARDTGYEGIACVDDTARAILLAFGIYEQCGSEEALMLALRWMRFVEYMQYPDGSFANFVRNAAGVRNATGATSRRGGYWWSARARWALARAYRITGNAQYLARYRACKLPPLPDGKINALFALAELELYRAEPSAVLYQAILDHCSIIQGNDIPYFLDHPSTLTVALWGYHQLHAVAASAQVLGDESLLESCRRTIVNLIEPDVRAGMWYSFPGREKDQICAYNVTPIGQGLAAMYRATGDRAYCELALLAFEWFYGRNDAHTPMYDPSTGKCRDGINNGVASLNYGAESSIEAGLAEIERRELVHHP